MLSVDERCIILFYHNRYMCFPLITVWERECVGVFVCKCVCVIWVGSDGDCMDGWAWVRVREQCVSV